jgi:hypothetical protein
MRRTGLVSWARIALVTVSAAIAASLLIMPTAEGATPTSGTLTDASGPLTYTAGPFTLANPTPVPVVDQGPECANPVQPCDEYTLTVSLPNGYTAQHPNEIVRLSATWTDTGAGQSDYDLYVYKGTVTTTDGSEAPYTKSTNSGPTPETTAMPVSDGTHTYTVIVVPFQPTAETVNVSIDLAEGAPGGGGGGGVTNFGGPTPTQPNAPRYQILSPPEGSGANGSTGEFNIGFNPNTGNYMTSSTAKVWRVTPPEKRTPALPASGPALWTDVSPSIASTQSLDPILVTDQSTGRTFVSNFTADPGLLFAFSDDDGATWTQNTVSPPNGGADHQTVGVGPYPSSLAGINPLYPNAVYYCSQADLPDMCSRSDSGGLEFGPGVPANNGVVGCHHFHGHLKVDSDGTAYLPLKDCGGIEGGDISTDGGNTWTEFDVPNSGVSQSDPSIGIDKNKTAYYCYTPNDGSAHVAVSHDGGTTWTDDHDIGASVGAVQAVFPEAVAGDPGRAACGFLATDKAGDFNSANFDGSWYLFIATTIDGGKTWTTVNATPNDPVQGAGGLCLAGTLTCGANRNLLDFNEITLDSQGHVAYGYDDGCVTQTCVGGGGAKNDYVAFQRIARQTGGVSLYADPQYNPAEPVAPQQPYVSGTRDSSKADLTWNAPDNGGSDITAYKIFRGTSSGSETQIATVLGTKTTYEDAAVSSSVPTYYYKVVAVNAQGSSPASNEAGLVVSNLTPPNPCKAPGATILTDPTGDSLTGVSGTDLKSLEVSQPYQSGGSLKLRFELDTDPGLNPEAPGSYWYVSFKDPDGSVHAVRMWFDPSNPTVPTFESYIASGNTSGTVDGRFVKAGSEKPADASSSYDPTNGTIVLIATASDLGLAPGDAIVGFNAASVQPASTPVGGAAETIDEMPDGLGYQGTFTLQTNAACAPNAAPTASLVATQPSKEAPSKVTFDGSGSSDPDAGDSIASYTFDFGDGSPSVTQSTPTIEHTYTEGRYPATLSVKDTHGKQSFNTASMDIEVEAAPTSFGDDATQIAYPKGWHTVNDADASSGHYRLGVAKGLSFGFGTEAPDGEITLDYGKSANGGTADVYLDGTKVGTLDFKGGSGTASHPVFGSSFSTDLTAGEHTLTLQNVKGPVNIDDIKVSDGESDEQPASAPGQTTASTGSLKGSATSTSKVTVPSSATALSVFAEALTPVKFTVTIISPSGKALAQATSKNGIVSLAPAISKAGVYRVQITNAGSKKLLVFRAATPYLKVG